MMQKSEKNDCLNFAISQREEMVSLVDVLTSSRWLEVKSRQRWLF